MVHVGSGHAQLLRNSYESYAKKFGKEFAVRQARGRERKKMNTTPVLVVDDSQITANIVTSLLKLCGFSNVEQALSAYSALGKLNTSKYGLILADMFMSGMTGVDLLAEVRSRPAFGTCTFLLMTAVRDREVIESAVRYKADGIILKPFTVAQLKQKLAGFPRLLAA
jgi:CheY-like chemotaxis protein